MEIGTKTIAAGVGLFFLGGLSVYFLTAKNDVPARAAAQYQAPAMQRALEQVRASKTTEEIPVTGTEDNTVSSIPTSEETEELTHDAFLAQAEARREQQLIDKAEADRLAKLRAAKERSVECKFWKQQQKTSSAAAKIEEKIIQYCTLQKNSSSASTSSNTSSEHSADSASGL